MMHNLWARPSEREYKHVTESGQMASMGYDELYTMLARKFKCFFAKMQHKVHCLGAHYYNFRLRP